MERRLAVIMSADLVGFTRLMERDETGTWAQLRALRKELIDPTLAAHTGTIFKTTGDGILAEFRNCVDAVMACVAVQSAVHERGRSVAADDRLEFRVGIDMGDVIVDEGDLIGDAVNVAARLEGICQPGGLCISEAVHNAIKRNSTVPFEDIGPVELHNRADPVRGFIWRYGSLSSADETWHTSRVIRAQAGQEMRKTGEKEQSSPLPSVAVLPFENFSGDEELGYFASGIAEDITTELYRFKSFIVIARTSAFMYAGEAKSAQEIGRELGARYVLEGSVRKLGARVRVTAQLIDVEGNDHVWAERYDSELAEIFDVQDQIVAKIVATLSDGIERHQLRASKHLAPAELEAYQLMLRGLDLHKQGYVSYAQAVEIHDLFSKAVEKDPNLGRARAWKVCAASRLWPAQAELNVIEEYVDDALVELKKVLASNSEDPEANRIYGALSLMRRDFEQAKFHIDRALAANPNNAHLLGKSANFYSHYGDPAKALELLERAVTINPHHPDWYWQEFGFAHWVAESYGAAVEHLNRSTVLTDFDHAYLAASHVAMGEPEKAAREVERFRAINPETTAKLFAARQPFQHGETRERLRQQLVAAGLA